MHTTNRQYIKVTIVKVILLVSVTAGIALALPLGLVWAQQQVSSQQLLDIVLLIDSSPSTEQTDPQQARLEAARYLLDYLEGIAQQTGVDVRVSVANFGGVVDRESAIPLSPLWDGSVRDAITATTNIYYTDFRPALEYALDQFTTHRVEAVPGTRAVILFTDGTPEFDIDPNVSGEQLSDGDKKNYFQGKSIEGDQSTLRMDQLLESLQEVGARLYVVSVGAQDQELWESIIPADQYQALPNNQANTRDLAAIYLPIASELTGLKPAEVSRANEGIPQGFEIPPYLEQMMLAILKDTPNVVVTLADPDGNTEYEPIITDSQSGRYLVYAISSPKNGKWNLTTQNGGAEVWPSRTPPRLELNVRTNPIPLGKPATFHASLYRGQELVNDPSLRMFIDVKGPNEIADVLGPIPQDTTGNFAVETSNLDVAGLYSATGRIELNGTQLDLKSYTAEFEAFPSPSIEMFHYEGVNGEIAPGANITISALVRHGDQLPNDAVYAHLKDATGETLARVKLVEQGTSSNNPGDRQYAGKMILPVEAGTYDLELVIDGDTVKWGFVNLSANRELDVPALTGTSGLAATPVPTDLGTQPTTTGTAVTPIATIQAPANSEAENGRSDVLGAIPVVLLVAAISLLAILLFALATRRQRQVTTLTTQTKNLESQYSAVSDKMLQVEQELVQRQDDWKVEEDALREAYNNQLLELQTRVNQIDRERMSLAEQLEGAAQAQELREKGTRLLNENKPEEARKALEDALTVTFVWSEESQLAPVEEVSRILTVMLDQLYKKDIDQQRYLIYRYLSNQPVPAAFLVGLAFVLMRRWAETPALFFDEFYGVMSRPKGTELLKWLKGQKPPPTWKPKIRQNAERIIELAVQTVRLNEILERTA